MARLREDARFKVVTPETFVVDVAVDDGGLPGPAGPLIVGESATDGEGEIWMDWAFVEFWKENYCERPDDRSVAVADITRTRRYYSKVYN